eukprot:5871835-Amphidinium_carterae.1
MSALSFRFALLSLRHFKNSLAVFSSQSQEEVEKCGAWIGVAPPHGVLPLVIRFTLPCLTFMTHVAATLCCLWKTYDDDADDDDVDDDVDHMPTSS